MGTDIVPARENFVPFFFEGLQMPECRWIGGVPKFTRFAMGVAAGHKNPQNAADKIIERNPYIKEYSTTDRVSVVQRSEKGQEYNREMDLELYDPIGLLLFLFESHTPKAKQVKVFVAKLVWAIQSGTYRPYPKSGDLRSALAQIRSAPPTRERGAMVKELAEQRGCSVQNIYSMMKKMGGGENLLTKTGLPKRTTRGGYRYRPEYKQTVDYLKDHPKAGGNRIKRELSLSVPAGTINRWIKTDGLRKSVR